MIYGYAIAFTLAGWALEEDLIVVLSCDDSQYVCFLGSLPQEGVRKFLDLSVLDSEISIFLLSFEILEIDLHVLKQILVDSEEVYRNARTLQ